MGEKGGVKQSKPKVNAFLQLCDRFCHNLAGFECVFVSSCGKTGNIKVKISKFSLRQGCYRIPPSRENFALFEAHNGERRKIVCNFLPGNHVRDTCAAVWPKL